jgi:hypothetical protein
MTNLLVRRLLIPVLGPSGKILSPLTISSVISICLPDTIDRTIDPRERA